MSENYIAKAENYVYKLNEIWNKRPEPKSENGAKNRQFQLMILNHILGNYIDGMNISISYYTPEITIENEEALLNLKNAIYFLLSQIHPKQGNNTTQQNNPEEQNNYEKIKQIAIKYKKLYEIETNKTNELTSKIEQLQENINSKTTTPNTTNTTNTDELLQTISQLKNLNDKYISALQERDKKITDMKRTISLLDTKIKEYLKESSKSTNNAKNSNEVPISKNTENNQTTNQLTQEIFNLNNKIQILEKENFELLDNQNKLLNHNNDLMKFIMHQKDMEDKILPFLQNTAYYRKYKGKSINLEPSQITSVYRLHLKGLTNYKISKETGISKTSIKKILTFDYNTIESLKKLLNALHTINKSGHWHNKNKIWITTAIKTVNQKIQEQSEKEKHQKEDIFLNLKTIQDFLNFTKNNTKTNKTV